MSQPKVSILIPAFNCEKWIADTLQSALTQTWPNKEIVVVDDGSTDRTFDVARQFTAPNVLVLRQSNSGAAAARNRAFAECQGDFVQWLDADDLLDARKISLQMAVFERVGSRRTLLSGEWGRFIHRSHRARFERTDLWADLPPVEWLLLKLARNLYIANACWLVSRELTEAAGPWDETLSTDDDGEYFARVLLHSDGTRFVDGAKMYYRKASFGSVSDIGRSQRKMQDHMRAMRLHIQYIRWLEDSPRVRSACLTLLQTGLDSFYDDRPDLFAEALKLATELGGTLDPPTLSWKYRWIAALFGRPTARRASVLMPRLKWSVIRALDEALLQLERPGKSGSDVRQSAGTATVSR